MAVIKCKMCGGSLDIKEGMTVATCEYCGTEQTLPRLDDDRKANLYDRANHFRRNNDFDKAMGIYESILNEDNTDSEAYWSLVLCRYGIEYVEDPVTHKRVPTVNRAQFTSIFDDEDYKAALKNADTLQRGIYEAEAKAINEIQKGILEISAKEEPFDCFISFKETDAQGRRTRDAVLAQDLYNELTKEGFKVFFAPVTLEDKLGTAYEPYIFAALNSSKVMVALGTKPEHFNAVWVKNEWSRYLALIKNGAKKTLIPAYRDMDPYDLPDEFSHLMAQDMSKLGFMQDLIRGIKKLLANDEPKPVAKAEPIFSAAPASVAPLLKRAFMFLEDGDWESADEYCEKVLDIDPECGEAYWGKFLASKRCKDAQGVIDRLLSKAHNVAGEEKAACEEAGDRIERSLEQNCVPGYLKEEEIVRLYAPPENYILTAPGVEAACTEFMAALNADRTLEKARRYASGKLKGVVGGLFKLVDERSAELVSEAKEADERRKSAAVQSYGKALDAADKAAAELNAKASAEREKDYNNAVAQEEKKDYYSAKKAFEALGDYRDSRERAKRCADKQIAAEKKAKSDAIRKIIIVGAAFAIIAAIVVIYYSLIVPLKSYNEAEALAEDGKLYDAAICFYELGDYSDAREKSFELWDKVAVRETISAGFVHTVGLKSDGTVVAVGENDEGQCDVSEWTDIVAVSTGVYHTVGLKSDGTVVAVGENDEGQCDVSEWTDIVAVSAGVYHTVGLKSDGTVVATEYEGKVYNGQCDVSGWTDIVAISAGFQHTVGLKSDGTVVAAGANYYGQCYVSDWTDIVAISAGTFHTVGLKSDGTVVATEYEGEFYDGQSDVSGWTDIVAISAGSKHTVGLKSDGTVVAAGRNDDGQCDVSKWTDIVAISAGSFHTVGLKSDGTVVAVGENEDGQCDVSECTDIKLPKK